MKEYLKLLDKIDEKRALYVAFGMLTAGIVFILTGHLNMVARVLLFSCIVVVSLYFGNYIKTWKGAIKYVVYGSAIMIMMNLIIMKFKGWGIFFVVVAIFIYRAFKSNKLLKFFWNIQKLKLKNDMRTLKEEWNSKKKKYPKPKHLEREEE